MAPILSMLAVSDVNPDQDEPLFPNTPGLNGDDACATLLHIIDTLGLEKVGPFLKAYLIYGVNY